MDKINSGKKQLSLAYKTSYEKRAGNFQGLNYDFVQTEIKPNHLAVVQTGRNGASVCVQDSTENSFNYELINRGNEMADEKSKQDLETKNATNSEDQGVNKQIEDLKKMILEQNELIKSNNEKIKRFEDGLQQKTSEQENADVKAEQEEKPEALAMDAAKLKEEVNRQVSEKVEDLKQAQILANDLKIIDSSIAQDSAGLSLSDIVKKGCEKIKVEFKNTQDSFNYLKGYIDGKKEFDKPEKTFKSVAMDSMKKVDDSEIRHDETFSKYQ